MFADMVECRADRVHAASEKQKVDHILRTAKRISGLARESWQILQGTGGCINDLRKAGMRGMHIDGKVSNP